MTTLADGNRITRTNTMHYYRDSSGRMRTEYQLAAIGPFVPQESQSIVDHHGSGSRQALRAASVDEACGCVRPVRGEGASVSATGKAILVGGVSTNIGAPAPGLSPTAGLATSAAPSKDFRVFSQRPGRGGSGGGVPSSAMPSPTMAQDSPGRRMSEHRLVERCAGSRATSLRGTGPVTAAAMPAAPAGDVFFVTAGPAGAARAGPNVKQAPQAVSIGERRIEGLKVTGSRLEFTIGAGEVGNEQPITVRTDQWFSPDLGVVVSSTHNDPMIGETTYRLEQINRAEPDASLFTVPADYAKSSVGR